MKNKTIISILLILFSTLAVADINIVAGPYLQNPATDGMTIIWLTDTKAYGEVELETKAGITQHYSIKDGFRGAFTTLHKVRVKGLEAGTKYRYRVTAKEITNFEPYKVEFGKTVVSEFFEFQTLSFEKEEATFVVFNDIHEKPAIVDNLLSHAESIDFELAFFNGDYFGHLEDEDHLVGTLLLHLDRWSAGSVPFLLSRGNHETRGKFARDLINYFDFPENKYYFSLRHGPFHIIVLDGGEDKEDNHWAYHGLTDFDSFRTEEAAWLHRELETEAFKAAPFKIVIIHMPPFSESMGYGMQECQKNFGPILNGKIDLMIAGHTHQRAVVKPDENHNYPIYIGGSPKDGKGTMMTVRANSNKLQLDVIGEDGKVLDSMEIVK